MCQIAWPSWHCSWPRWPGVWRSCGVVYVDIDVDDAGECVVAMCTFSLLLDLKTPAFGVFEGF